MVINDSFGDDGFAGHDEWYCLESCVSGDGVNGDIDDVDDVGDGDDGALARPTSQPFAFLRPILSVS